MRKAIKSALSGVVIGAVAACAIPTELFAMSAAPLSAAGLSPQVDKVWYRRWGGGYRPYYGRYRWSGYRGYRPYYGRGYNPGAVAAAGLLGAGLAAAGGGYYGGYYPYYNYNYYYPGYNYGYYNYPSYDYWGW